jgi:hypothetical protein
MTAEEGFMMFLFSMISFATLAMIAWFVIDQVINEKKDEE